MVRLLAIDIDGTLLDSRGRLPDAHREALIEAVAQGVEVALVTGRSFHFPRPVVALLPVPLTLIWRMNCSLLATEYSRSCRPVRRVPLPR